MTKATYRQNHVERITHVGRTDGPLVGLKGFGSTDSFAESGKGAFNLNLNLELSEKVDALPVSRDKGGGNWDADVNSGMITVHLTHDQQLSLAMELLSVYREYEKHRPVTRRGTGPNYRGR